MFPCTKRLVKIKSILPVRIEFDYVEAEDTLRRRTRLPQWYAMLVATTDSHHLLPIYLELKGSHNRLRKNNLVGWRAQLREVFGKNGIRTEDDLQNDLARVCQTFLHFRASPILHCRDAVLMQREQIGEEDQWTTRRFADAWYLEPDLELNEHRAITGRANTFRLASWECFTETAPLVEKILEKSLVVDFFGPVPTHPFELLRLEEFELRRPSASRDWEADWQLLLRDIDAFDEDADAPQDDSLNLVRETYDIDDSDDLEAPEDHVENGEHNIEQLALDTPTAITATFRSGLRHQLGINVNGKPSCQMFMDCHLERELDSRYCIHHSRVLLGLLRDPIYMGSFAGPRWALLNPHRLKPEQYECLVELRRLVVNEPERVWIIDTEFQALSQGKCPFVMEFAARNGRNEKILDFKIDYGGRSVGQVLQLIMPFAFRDVVHMSAAGRSWRQQIIISSFLKNYRSARTHGISILDARKAILATGYDPKTHVLLSWGTTLDLTNFARLLGGDEAPVVDSTPVSHYMNIFRICKDMLPLTFPSASLSVVDRAIRNGPAVTYHRADVDVMVAWNIVFEMIDTIQPRV